MRATAPGSGRAGLMASVAAALALLLVGGALPAQSSSSSDSKEKEMATILDRHSDLTDQAKAVGQAAYSPACAASTRNTGCPT